VFAFSSPDGNPNRDVRSSVYAYRVPRTLDRGVGRRRDVAAGLRGVVAARG
jgi:hypothetical protein